MSIRHLTNKKRKLRKENKKSMVQNNQNGPRQITAEEAITQMNQTLGTVRGQIEQQKANYANSYVTLASRVAEGLVLDGKNIEDSVNTAFAFMEAFRVTAMVEVERLKDVAPVEDILLKQEAAMVDNLEKVQQLIIEHKRKEEEQQAQAISNVVEFPTEAVAVSEESPAV